MHQHKQLTVWLLLCLGLSSGVSAAVELNSSDIVAPDHERAKMGIERKYQSDKTRCAQMQGNEKEACDQKAQSTARINEQSLDARDKGRIDDHVEAGEARTEAQYDLDKVRCADMSGDSKTLCMQKAQTQYEKSKAEIDFSKNTLDESRNAVKNRTEAEYAIALKKCDRFNGAKKDHCQDLAKEKYRQN